MSRVCFGVCLVKLHPFGDDAPVLFKRIFLGGDIEDNSDKCSSGLSKYTSKVG